MQKAIKLRITTTRKQAVTTSSIVRAFCPICQTEVPTLACVEAAGFLQIGEEELAALIAVGRIHATETASGTLRICQGSLISK